MNIKTWLFGILLCVSVCAMRAQNARSGYSSPQHQPPEVDFSWTNACFGDTTFFTNGSIRASTYTWTVYDKTLTPKYTSSAVNISYYFPTPDTFYVELVADNGHITSSFQTVVIDSMLHADFFFMHCSNQFMNHSTCATSFFWDFGDGTTSTSILPMHTYADTGYYNVTFIAYKGTWSDTVKKQIYVDPQAFPTGATSYVLSGDTLFVHAVDSMAGMFYNWNFGMGIHLYARDTFYILPDTGTYVIYFADWNTCDQANTIDTIRYYINSISTETQSILNIFPNPIERAQELSITYDGQAVSEKEITVSNSLGEMLLPESYRIHQTTNGLKLRFYAIEPGIYFVRFKSQTRSYASRFIVLN